MRKALVVSSIGLAIIACGAVVYRSYVAPSGQPAPIRAEAPAIPVITEIARTTTFVERRRTIGTLESPAIVTLRSRIDSQIVDRHVEDGQLVQQGQLMFTLDDREIRATIARDEASLAKERVALVQAKSNLDRRQQLVGKGVTTQAQLDEAVAAYRAAVQTVEAAEAVVAADKLRLGYAQIEAPMTGRLGTIRVATGNLVSASASEGIATITRVQPLRVSFSLPEQDLTALRAAAARPSSAAVRVFVQGAAEPAASGTLDFVDSAVDVSSGTIAARASMPNESLALWPGQYVEVEIELGQRPRTIMLPTTALVMGQQGPYVFVARDDGTVAVLNVTNGGVVGNRTAILAGVDEGVRIVVEGQSRLSPGARWSEGRLPTHRAERATAAESSP